MVCFLYAYWILHDVWFQNFCGLYSDIIMLLLPERSIGGEDGFLSRTIGEGKCVRGE